jgi:hypothetical protein
LPQLRFAIRHFNVEIVRAFRACSHRRPAASARFENAERLVDPRLTEPADDHSDDACGHRQGRRPAERPQPAGDRELYKIVEVVGVSEKSWEDAGRNAVETAAGSLRDLRVAEVTKNGHEA